MNETLFVSQNIKNLQKIRWQEEMCHLSRLLFVLGSSSSVLLNIFHKSSAIDGGRQSVFFSETADKIIFKII